MTLHEESSIKTKVKLESFDHKLLAIACNSLITGISCINGVVKGPIFLPTKRRIYCVLQSPHIDKKSREHFEIKIHKRVLYVYTSNKLENIADSFLKIAIPPGVSIKLS
jgi:small subunit ribosomal protein S10